MYKSGICDTKPAISLKRSSLEPNLYYRLSIETRDSLTIGDKSGTCYFFLLLFYFYYSARNARIASAVLAIAIPSVRSSVRLSVRPSHAGIVSKRRHVARCSLHRWIAKCV